MCLWLNSIKSRKTLLQKTHSGRVLTIWWLLHMLRHFDPPFWGLWKICIVSIPIFGQTWGKCRISTPIFVKKKKKKKKGKMYCFEPPFWPFVAFRVNGRWWASLSETQPRTHNHRPRPRPRLHPIFLKHNSPRPNDASVSYINIRWDNGSAKPLSKPILP